MIPSLGKPVVMATLACMLVSGAALAGQIEANLGGLTGENTEKYLEPLPDAFSAAINTAVFRTGYVPKAGINFTVGAVAMIVAYDEDLTTYQPIYPVGFTPAAGEGIPDVPTVTGDGEAVPVEGEGGLTLYFPGGFDMENLAVAVPQLYIGSIMGTRAVVRWISLDLGDAEIGDLELFGIGAQHSISQYFPLMPVDVAAGIFYQTFNVGDDLIDTSALHFNVTGSKTFSVLTPYVGLGLDTFKMDVTYDSDVSNDKIEVDFDRNTNVHVTAGASANLAIVHANLEFNYGATTSIAAGLGFGFDFGLTPRVGM